MSNAERQRRYIERLKSKSDAAEIERLRAEIVELKSELEALRHHEPARGSKAREPRSDLAIVLEAIEQDEGHLAKAHQLRAAIERERGHSVPANVVTRMIDAGQLLRCGCWIVAPGAALTRPRARAARPEHDAALPPY